MCDKMEIKFSQNELKSSGDEWFFVFLTEKRLRLFGNRRFQRDSALICK